MTQGINTQEEQNTCAADASAGERERDGAGEKLSCSLQSTEWFPAPLSRAL